MENCIDFLNFLDPDTSIKILTCLEDVSDLVRVSCVSRTWRRHVIASGLCKQLCLRMFPQLSRVSHVVDPSCNVKEPTEIGSKLEWGNFELEHRVYAFLARGCTTFPIGELTLEPMRASSTDNYPEERIDNTLEPRDRIGRTASYWSSKGQSNPAVPETLTYKLLGDLCVIAEINIQPFQAYFQRGQPIYSAKAVRFQMGHAKFPIDDSTGGSLHDSADDISWTYTSQEFPMAQENCLQKFKLPEPVLCIGGVVRIELLGRVQRQEMDGLFYICVSHVQIRGRPLSPAFGIDILEPSGKVALKVLSYKHEDSSAYVQRRGREPEQIIHMFPGDFGEYEAWIEEEDDEAGEFIL